MEWITILFSYSIIEYEKVQTAKGNKRLKPIISNYKQSKRFLWNFEENKWSFLNYIMIMLNGTKNS